MNIVTGSHIAASSFTNTLHSCMHDQRWVFAPGEVMLGDLFRSGFEIVDDHEDADAIVVNTCSFVEEAKTESLEVLGSCLITVHMAIFAHNVATALEYAQIDRQMFCYVDNPYQSTLQHLCMPFCF